VQYYNTLKQLDYVPEWYDKTSQDSAYKMLQLYNQGKSWVDWTVDETDTELVNFLDKANVPPVEAMADFDKDKFKDRAWRSMPPQPPQSPQSPTTEPNFLEKLQAGTFGAGHWANNSGNWSYVPEGMTDEKWHKLDFLQKAMNYKTLPYQMFNSVLWLGMGAAVAGGISAATVGTGVPIGLAVGGTIAGAGILGQTGALGPQVQGTTQVLGQLADSFAIATEMALGSIEIADVVAKDYIKGDLKSLGEVMETLNAISPLYYESMGVAVRGTAVDWKNPPLETWHEGTPGVVASEPINVGPGTGFNRWGEVAGGVMDMIYADYKAARTPQEKMELNAKWIDKLGMYGELGDFFLQMILDPGEAIMGTVGKSFSNKAGMGKVAASTENPQIIAAVNSVDGEMAKLAAFRVTAESTPITEVAKYSPIARKLAGVKQGADGAWLWVKEQPQSNEGLGFLVNHTPVSRAMSMLKNSYDVLGSWAIGKTPEELFGELATIAKLTPEELQNSIEVMPQKLGGRAVYEALKLSADKLSSLYTVTWAGQNSNRQLLTGISEALNIPFITVQDSLIKDGVGDKYLTDLKAIKDLPNNLKEYVQKPGVNGDTLKMAANSFKTSKAVISVDAYRGEVLNTVLKDIESVVVGKEWANVTPETNLFVRWGKLFKNVQGLLSLDSNPIYVLGNMWGDFFSFNHHLGTLSIFTDTEKVFKNLGFAPLIQSFGDSLGVESNITVSDRFGEIIKATSKSPNDTLYKLNDLVSNIRSRNFLSLQNIVKGLERGLSERAVAAGVLQYIKGNPVNIPVTPELISFLSGVGIDPVYLRKIVENTSITDLTELMHYQPPAIKFRELVTFASPEIQAELDGRIEKITKDAREYGLSPEEVKDQIADLIGEYIIKDAEENYVKAINNGPVVREKISEACKAEGVTLAILRVLDELNVEELSTRNLHVNSISSIWHLRAKDRTAILNAESSRFRTARAIRMQKYMALAREVVGDNSTSEGFAKVINTTLEIDARWDDFYTKRNQLWRDLYNFNRDDNATNRVLTVARAQFNMSEKYLNSRYQIDLDWKRVYTEEITKMLNNNYLEIMEIDKKQISELDDFVARLTNYDPMINKNRAERTGVREIMLGAMIYFRSGDSTILDNAENRELGEQVKNHVSAIAGEGRQFGSVDKTTGQVRQQYWRKFQSIMTSLDIMYSQLSLYAPSGTSTSLIQGQINAEYSRILEKYKKELEAREKIKDWNIWKAAEEQGILTATSTGVPTNTHLWNMLMKYAKDIILQTVVIPTKLTYSIREEILSQVTQEVFDAAIERRNNADILDVKNQKPQLYNSLQLYEKEMVGLRNTGGVVNGEYARILEELRVIFKESNKAEACLALVKIAMRNAAVNAQNRGIRKSEAQFAREFSVTNEESNVAELRNLQDPEQLMFSIIASHPGVKDTVGKFTTDGGNTLARNSFWSSSSKDKVFGKKVFYYSDEKSGKAPQRAILRMANPWDMDAVVRAEQWKFLVKHKFVERTQFQERTTTEYKLSDDAKLRLAKLLQAGNGGYDGIIQKVGNRTDYIIFSESQTFGLGTRSLSQTDGKPLFFSPLREGISGFKSIPKTGAQWLKALGKMANIPNTRPQVEMRDRGFDTWLEERRNTVVTQEEVQKFLDSTEIEMVETELGLPPEPYKADIPIDIAITPGTALEMYRQREESQILEEEKYIQKKIDEQTEQGIYNPEEIERIREEFQLLREKLVELYSTGSIDFSNPEGSREKINVFGRIKQIFFIRIRNLEFAWKYAIKHRISPGQVGEVYDNLVWSQQIPGFYFTPDVDIYAGSGKPLPAEPIITQEDITWFSESHDEPPAADNDVFRECMRRMYRGEPGLSSIDVSDDVRWGIETFEEFQEKMRLDTNIRRFEVEVRPPRPPSAKYSEYSVRGLQDSEYSELILGDKNISYTSAHFSDIPNYLMHVRYQTATIEGKKMLVVDEIQSDVFQDAKHLIKGKNITSLTEEMPHGFFVGKGDTTFHVYDGKTDSFYETFDSEQEALDYINNTEGKVPSTVPFKDNWSRVAIKRLLAEAVKKGAEGIVIVPGSVQAGRYVVPPATKIRVQPLYYVVDNNAIASVWDTPMPLAEALAAKTGNQRIIEHPTGKIEVQGRTYQGIVSIYLEKFVGIPLAKQILATTPDADGWFSSTPEMFQTDPRIKPMEAFYDVSVIKTLKALLGTDPSQIKLTKEVPAANSFIFTPENKQSISNGQALYAKTGNITFADEDKVIVGIFKDGDVNTIVHEVIGHYCTHHLSKEHGDILTSWIKQMHPEQYAEVMSRFDDPNADPGEWWRAQDKSLFRSWHELVATASETYMRSTHTSFTSFAPEIKVFLTLLHEWMVAIYNLVNRHHQVNLTPEVRGVFDDILKIGTTEIGDPLPGVTLKEVQARQEAYFATSVLDSYLDEHLPDILKECPTFYREVVQRYEEDAVRDGTIVNIRYAVRDVTERNDTDYRITHCLPPGVDAYSSSISEVIQGIDEFVRYLSYSDYALDPKTVKVEGKYIQYQVMKIGEQRTGGVNNKGIRRKNDQRVINMAYFPVMGEYLREYKLGVALNFSPELIVYKLQNTVVKAKGKLTLDYKSDPRTMAIFRNYAVPALEEIMNSVGYTISKNISWKDGVLTIQGMAIPDWVAPTDMEGSIPDEVRPVVNVDVANVTVKDSLMFNYKERREIMEKISKLQGKLGLKRTLPSPIWAIFPGEIDTQAEYMSRINEGQKRNLPEYTPSIEESPEHIMPPYNIPTSKPEKEFAGEIIPQIEDTSCPLMRKLMEKYGHPNINYALQVIRQDMVRSTEEDHHYIMPYNPKDKQGTDILIQALQEVADSTVYTTSDGIKYEFTFRLNDVKEHPRSARPYSYLGPFLEITITKKLPKLTTQVAEPMVTFDDDGYAIFTEEHLEWIDLGDPARIGELIAIYGREAVDFEMMVSKEFNQQGNLPDASVLNQGEEPRLSREEIRRRKKVEENKHVQENDLPDSAGIRGEPPASDEAKPDSVKEQSIEPMHTSAVPKEEGADDSGLANRSKKTPMQATPGFFPLPNEIIPEQATPGVLPPLPVEEINNEITEKDAYAMDEALISLNPMDLKLQGPLIDELREKILAKDPTANIDEIMAKISEQLQVYMDKAKNIKRDHKLAAIRWGEHVRDVSLLNYADSRGMDNYLMAIFPYEYWYTRSGINWMTYFIDHPNYALRTARLARFLQDEYEEEGFPEKLKGKMRIDIPFLPKELGGSIYVDPIRMPFPWLQALEGVTTILRDARIEEKRVIRAIEDRARAEDITEEEAKQAIENKQGKIWEEAKNGIKIESGDISSFPNTVSKILAPSIFAKSALTALQGGNPAKDISQFPGSRAVQTLTGVAEAGGIGRGFIPPGGWNIEDYAREMLGNTGIPKINKTQDNAIDALISAMVSEGKATLQEGRDAMVNRKGKLYDEALRRQAVYGGLKYAGSLLGLNPALFSDGEKRGMEASKALEAAYKLEAKGPKGAVEAFWKKYPDYALKARIMDKDPEYRIRKFVIADLHNTFKDMETINKKAFTDKAGREFVDGFLDSGTRNYDNIKTDTLIMWSQAMKGYVPEKAEVPTLSIDYAPDDIAKAAQQYYDMKKKWGMSPYQQMMTDLKTDEERNAFIRQIPNYRNYQRWNNKQLANMDPKVIPWVTNENSELYGVDPVVQKMVYQYRDEREKYEWEDTTSPKYNEYMRWKNETLATNPSIIPYVVGNTSPMYGFPIELQQYVYAYRAMRDKNFPNYLQWQDEYFAKTNKKERMAYLATHKRLTDYWTFRDKAASDYPQAAAFVKSEESLRGDILGYNYPTASEYNSFSDILNEFSPELRQQTLEYKYSGTPLGTGGTNQLARIADNYNVSVEDVLKYVNSQ
jgi:hypothetical protein